MPKRKTCGGDVWSTINNECNECSIETLKKIIKQQEDKLDKVVAERDELLAALANFPLEKNIAGNCVWCHAKGDDLIDGHDNWCPTKIAAEAIAKVEGRDG